MGRRDFFSFEELIVVIVMKSQARSVGEVADLTKRSKSSIRQKFKNLPSLDSSAEKKKLIFETRFESISDIYAAFGVPCPETQAELEQDMFERFKRWEKRLLRGLPDDNCD